jgi:hypothetical protein
VLAERLVHHAIVDGESSAFQQIADRLEGKPLQPVAQHTVDHRSDIREYSIRELTEMLAECRARRADQKPREECEMLN